MHCHNISHMLPCLAAAWVVNGLFFSLQTIEKGPHTLQTICESCFPKCSNKQPRDEISLSNEISDTGYSFQK